MPSFYGPRLPGFTSSGTSGIRCGVGVTYWPCFAEMACAAVRLWTWRAALVDGRAS